MIENALVRNNVSFKVKITVKALISAGIIALAVALPQLAHLTFGQSAGIMLLPMYLPVPLGGCLLGSAWAAGIGLLSPLVSFVLTSAISAPMPAAARLPFMMSEFCVFCLGCGCAFLAKARSAQHYYNIFKYIVPCNISGCIGATAVFFFCNFKIIYN